MTIKKRDPYPGEVDTVHCNFCDSFGEMGDSGYDLPYNFHEVGGEHVCEDCYGSAILWALNKMRDSGSASNG